MKKLIFAALAGIVIVTAGCVSTVTDTSSPALTWSTDKISARYQRFRGSSLSGVVRRR